MNELQVFSRSAIEALRAGVPSRHAVEQLGTTQLHIKSAFEDRLSCIASGGGVEPLVISANFGGGKSHLLNYLKQIAANSGYVTSFVVVSPEMPLGNPHLVLRAIAEAAEAPGRTGRALRALASDLNISSDEFVSLRIWAGNAGIDERFAALIYLYEELRADEEFRTQILGDFEGSPLGITLIRQKLRELGQAVGYAFQSKRNSHLAHDRIRTLAQFYRTCGASGWVVLFDELERFERFPTKQRLAVWEELGRWKQIAAENGAGILPVFAVVEGAMKDTIQKDEPLLLTSSPGLETDVRDELALSGTRLIANPMRLISPTIEEIEGVKYRTRAVYKEAYGETPIAPPYTPGDDLTPIRSLIRRWITLWDLSRCFPDYTPSMVSEEVTFDSAEGDAAVFAQDEDNE